jgi:hypothetical protein
MVRLIKPKVKLASAAVYLASDEAAYITGQRIFVEGGMEDAQLRSPGLDVPIDLGIAARLARTRLVQFRAANPVCHHLEYRDTTLAARINKTKSPIP